MANVITAVYCLKAKKDRTNIEMYGHIVDLINRQIRQGGILQVQGLFEAKKNFRCDDFDDYKTGFSVSKGEYFLLVNGEYCDTNCWRLRRACRSEEETQTAWILSGVPDNDAVYEDAIKVEKHQDPKLVENKYFKQLSVIFMSSGDKPSASASDNYISVYDISEKTPKYREDTWAIRKYTAEDFADKPELLSIFKQLIQCDTAKSMQKIADRKALVDELIKRHYVNSDEMSPHHSSVIAVIDGKNDNWRCGIWCYKHPEKEDVEYHEVDSFKPDEYEYDLSIGWIPIFK